MKTLIAALLALSASTAFPADIYLVTFGECVKVGETSLRAAMARQERQYGAALEVLVPITKIKNHNASYFIVRMPDLDRPGKKGTIVVTDSIPFCEEAIKHAQINMAGDAIRN